MLLPSTFLIFLALSVAAIPLGPRSSRQTPRSPSLIPEDLTQGLPLHPADLFNSFPLPLPKPVDPKALIGRFIMDADYSSGSSPPAFFGKSPHKRADPLSNVFSPTTLRYNDVKEEIPPPNVA